jgi:flavin-dependent thymidylate synthase
MPEVQLINYTGAGTPDPARHAANVLVFTKQTRLEMRKNLMDEVAAWPWEKMLEELKYMANTIPSSWEFIEYSFLINDVTRAFTHQFVRTRTGSYAQQTMRVLNVNGWTYGTGPSIENDVEMVHLGHGDFREDVGPNAELYHDTMATLAATYDALIEGGAKIEDARGILPTNIHTNIVAKFSLRTLADTARKRASGRTQGEYREVMNAMLAEVIRVHPWAELFLTRTFDVAAAELEEIVRNIYGMNETARTHAIKLIDQMRATA